jgi:hypothetical protein
MSTSAGNVAFLYSVTKVTLKKLNKNPILFKKCVFEYCTVRFGARRQPGIPEPGAPPSGPSGLAVTSQTQTRAATDFGTHQEQ